MVSNIVLLFLLYTVLVVSHNLVIAALQPFLVEALDSHVKYKMTHLSSHSLGDCEGVSL